MTTLSDAELSNKKLAAGLTGIFLGAFGVHKFILGYTKPAVIMLVVSLAGGGDHLRDCQLCDGSDRFDRGHHLPHQNP